MQQLRAYFNRYYVSDGQIASHDYEQWDLCREEMLNLRSKEFWGNYFRHYLEGENILYDYSYRS